MDVTEKGEDGWVVWQASGVSGMRARTMFVAVSKLRGV